MRRFLLAGAALALSLALPRSAQAQLGGLSLGAAAGVVTPHRDVSGFSSGVHLEGLADLSLPLVPIGFRGEVAYDQMNGTSTSKLKVASGVVNATFSLPFPLLHPYAIGGAGYYVHNSSAGIGAREGKVGFNAGVGLELKLPVVRAFAEARYHAISYSGGKVGLVPVSVGVIF